MSKYGIPYVRSMIEMNGITLIPNWELEKWAMFWRYFENQWMPILSSWNICNEDGSIIKIVNRTNNALESYNKQFNSLFSKIPTPIKFVLLVEEETRCQADTLQNIKTGKNREEVWGDVGTPEISDSYYAHKDMINKQDKTTGKGYNKSQNPSNTAKPLKPVKPVKSAGKKR